MAQQDDHSENHGENHSENHSENHDQGTFGESFNFQWFKLFIFAAKDKKCSRKQASGSSAGSLNSTSVKE